MAEEELSGVWPASSSVGGMEQQGSLQFVRQPISSKLPLSVLQRRPSLSCAGHAAPERVGPVHTVRGGAPSSHSSPAQG